MKEQESPLASDCQFSILRTKKGCDAFSTMWQLRLTLKRALLIGGRVSGL
jgi:hypothetical protein